MNLQNFIKNPKLEISNFNGWERIWFFISVLVFIPTLLIWWFLTDNPFSGFSDYSKKTAIYDASTRLWESKEVDCKLNEKYVSEEWVTESQKSSEITQRIHKLEEENRYLSEDIYWFTAESKRKIRVNEGSISILRASRDRLFNTPTLIKQRGCNKVVEDLNASKTEYETSKNRRFEPLFSFIKTFILVLIYYILFIAALYFIGYSLGWIYRGFRK